MESVKIDPAMLPLDAIVSLRSAQPLIVDTLLALYALILRLRKGGTSWPDEEETLDDIIRNFVFDENATGITQLQEMHFVLQHGAAKYGEYNWINNENVTATNCVLAAMRHLLAICMHEYHCSESKLSHMAHAKTRLLFAKTLIRHDSVLKSVWGAS